MSEHNLETFSWPCAYAPVISNGVFRSAPEDFKVCEHLSFELSQDGEHCFLLVEKRSANTQWVVQQLAKLFKVKPMAVGYAGLKDRHSVSQQWFSVHTPGVANPETIEPQEDFSIVQIERNNKKLKQGAIDHNTFQLVLRNIEADKDAVNQRLALIRSQGVPNYFGMQRFGHHGANISKAVRMLNGQLRAKRSQSSIYLSALRSWFFNQYLAYRIEQGNWCDLLAGDRVNLNGSRSFFVNDSLSDDMTERLASGDIHVAGPMPGKNFLNQEILESTESAPRINYSDIWKPHFGVLSQIEVNTDWRSLRVLPNNLVWEWQNDTTLQIGFDLPSGSFATSVLKALGTIEDGFAVKPVTDARQPENKSEGAES